MFWRSPRALARRRQLTFAKLKRKSLLAETLEPRRVMDANPLIMVTALDDSVFADGHLSLREALQLAAQTPGPDEIAIAKIGSGIFSLTQPSALTIDSDVTIRPALASDRITITRSPLTNPNFRIFEVASQVTVTLQGLDLVDGVALAGDGGAIRSAGTLKLQQVNIRDSHASGKGGAIAVEVGASLEMFESTIVDSTSGSHGGGISVGNGAHVILDKSMVRDSTANGDGGGIFVADGGELTMRQAASGRNVTSGEGGGIFISPLAQATLITSTVSENHSQLGSAISNQGALSITRSTILGDNNASSDQVVIASGGQFTMFSSILGNEGSAPSFTGSLVTRGYNLIANRAEGLIVTDPALTTVHGDIVGGAGSETIIPPRLSILQDNGGPTWTNLPLPGSRAIDHSVLQHPDLLITEVGVDQRSGPRSVDGLDWNDWQEATSAPDIGATEFGVFFVNQEVDDVDASLLGNGLADIDPASFGSQVTLRAAVQELNAMAGFGNTTQEPTGVMQGVILIPAKYQQLKLTRTGRNEDWASSGDLDVYGKLLVRPGPDATGMNVSNSNSLQKIWGGAQDWQPVDFDPRGMVSILDDRLFHVRPDSQLRIEELELWGGGGGTIFSRASQGWTDRGGVIFVDDGQLTISNTRITRSNAIDGGAIYIDGGEARLDHSVLYNNWAMNDGAGVYLEDGNLIVDQGTTIKGNHGNSDGVGIYQADGETLITGQSVISDNAFFKTVGQEFNRGGALYVGAGTARVTGHASLLDNRPFGMGAVISVQGGAIFNAANLIVDDSVTFMGNASRVAAEPQPQGINLNRTVPAEYSIFEGGAIYNRGTATITDAVFDGSTQWAYLVKGDAIYNASGGVLNVDGTEFRSHNAGVSGAIDNFGVVYNNNGLATIIDSKFTDSAATNGDGGALVNEGFVAHLTVMNSLFQGGDTRSGSAIRNINGHVVVHGSLFDDNVGNYWANSVSSSTIDQLNRYISTGASVKAMTLELADSLYTDESVAIITGLELLARYSLPITVNLNAEKFDILETVNAIFDFQVTRESVGAHLKDSPLFIAASLLPEGFVPISTVEIDEQVWAQVGWTRKDITSNQNSQLQVRSQLDLSALPPLGSIRIGAEVMAVTSLATEGQGIKIDRLNPVDHILSASNQSTDASDRELHVVPNGSSNSESGQANPVYGNLPDEKFNTRSLRLFDTATPTLDALNPNPKFNQTYNSGNPAWNVLGWSTGRDPEVSGTALPTYSATNQALQIPWVPMLRRRGHNCWLVSITR